MHLTSKCRRDNRALDRRVVQRRQLADRRRRLDAHPHTTALPGTDITSLDKNSTVELTLTSPSSISLTGYTALRLGISGGQPNGDNYVQIATLEHTSRPEPQLSSPTRTPGGATPPVNSSAPVVSGVAQVGRRCRRRRGRGRGRRRSRTRTSGSAAAPVALNIAGRQQLYTVVAADLGATLRAVVTASNTPGRRARARRRRRRDRGRRDHRHLQRSRPAATTATSASAHRSRAATRPPAARRQQRPHHLTAGRRAAFGKYQVLNSLLRFDTSAFPTTPPSPRRSCAAT